MRTPSLVLALAIAGGFAFAEEGEPQLPVLAKQEVTLKSRSDADVQAKELWYRRFDGKAWGEWQKHGLTYARDNPVVWAPPEGRLQTYVRIIEVNGAAMPVPQGDAKPVTEFVIDRTPPAVAITWPTPKTKLRGGQPYTVKWTASDPNIAANPVAIEWSRDGSAFESVVDGLPNSGSQQITMPRDMTPTGVLRVSVRDRAGNIGSAESNQLLVDSIAPTGKILGPAISASLKNEIAIEVHDSGPAGLSASQLWFSADDGQTWAEGPEITDGFKTIPWTAQRDGRYRLALVSTDQAGNTSPVPRGKGEDQGVLLIDTVKPVIQIANAVGITRAGDEKGDARNYKPGDRVQVQFVVKDANLPPNPVAIYLQTDPQKGWTELGKDLPADAAFRFEIPRIPEKRAECRIRVVATDVAGNIGEAVSTETFVIKTVVETGPSGLDDGGSGLEDAPAKK